MKAKGIPTTSFLIEIINTSTVSWPILQFLIRLPHCHRSFFAVVLGSYE